jgi:hypothetical protein
MGSNWQSAPWSRIGAALVFAAALVAGAPAPFPSAAAADGAPVPLLQEGRPVDWWFVYKFNAARFQQCGVPEEERACPFGGKGTKYKASQQFAVASSEDHALKQGAGCAGTSVKDPLGATFDQIYQGRFHYVVWNDQFYKDPKVRACTGDSCGGPWGHSKGILAWDDDGEGIVLQVTTPSWPASGSKQFARKSGNTLGCIARPNNVQNAQHFFALKLNRKDVETVLRGLANASVVTDLEVEQLARIGGPAEIRALVQKLGDKSDSTEIIDEKLSSGVRLVSKPSALNVPPWQMLSSVLGGADLRTATWWASPQIPTTIAEKKIGCWDDALQPPGAVEIALTGQWDGEKIGLRGGQNHAKIGVAKGKDLAIFGDLNQQGSLSGRCKSSQNGRGGMFYVLNDRQLSSDMAALMEGDTAPQTLKAKKAKAKTAKAKKPKAKKPKKARKPRAAIILPAPWHAAAASPQPRWIVA